jgi:uncharacterized protein with NRDE domain
MEENEARKNSFSGFNLLACDGEELWVLSNRDGGARKLEPGVYGLGNLLLDTPDVDAPKREFQKTLQGGPALESLFELLTPWKIVAPEYGTRCSTVLVSNGGRTLYAERPFDAAGAESATARYEFQVKR